MKLKTKTCTGGARLSLALIIALASLATAQAQDPRVKQAGELMQKKLYADAIRILDSVVAQDTEQPAELRMLAECHYLLGDYAKARPLFSRALRKQVSLKGKMICESRLALIAYRLKDFSGANERIDSYIRKYPTDKRVGTLIAIRIKMTAAGSKANAEKIRLIEADVQRLRDNTERYGYYNAAMSAKILGDLYIASGQEDRAISLFTSAVHEMRGVASELKGSSRPVPKDLMQGVDSMSLQVATYHIERKRWSEARKWLENVNYVEHMKWQARLLLAQIAYQRRDYKTVIETLPESFLRGVPKGITKSNMHLLLGYAFKEGKKADLESAKTHLKRVLSNASGYHQAQQGLADIYRDQKDEARAEKHYLVSVKSQKYAPLAHFELGSIYRRWADRVPGSDAAAKEKRKALTQKAASHFAELIQRFPLTAAAGKAKPLLAELQEQGATATISVSSKDQVAHWEKTIRERPKSNEAAQALLSLANHYSRAQPLPGAGGVRPPDWKACVEAANQILSNGATPFAGVSAARWQQMRARAQYLLGRAELGSIPAGASARRLGEAAPTPIEGGGDAGRAIKAFDTARGLTGTDQEDFRKDIELALIEAMFKSTDPATLESAQTLYASREAEYRQDPRYQKMTLALADWYVTQTRYEAAARAYRDVARKSDLDRDEVMHLLYLAGLYFNKAGRKAAREQNAEARLGLRIYPSEVIKKASMLETHEPFQRVKDIRWSSDKPGPLAVDVLKRVSQKFGVPFIWSPIKIKGSVADALATRHVDPAKLAGLQQGGRLEEYIRLIVDLDRFRVDFDYGTSRGKPTLSMAEMDEFASEEESRIIEIYNPKRERFPSLAKPYGVFSQVHPEGTMIFNVIERIEETTGSRVFWADGVDKEDTLAHELRKLEGTESATCRDTLALAVVPLGLSVEVIRRDRLNELMAESNDSFNELRKFGMDTAYAEKALFNIAVNFYFLKEYEKMKLALREYRKVFDSPSHSHYYDAAYWLGWVFERDRKFREAVKHFTTAAEERVVLYREPGGTPTPGVEELEKLLAYDTLVGLSTKISGDFTDAELDARVLPFIRFNTNIEISLDPSARGITNTFNMAAFESFSALEILQTAMAHYGLSLRSQNANPEVAEKAYFRMASVYRKDDRMFEALENVNTLLSRFPETERRPEALKLKLDIYKGLKDYGRALDTLAELRKASKDAIDAYKLDYEAGRLYFDMCDYARAETFYSKALTGSAGRGEWLKIREALALAYARQPGKETHALTQYRDLLRYESSQLRQSINRLMYLYMQYMVSKEREREPLPEEEAEFIARYESLSDKQRALVAANEAARATWIYYVSALLDMQESKTDEALRKLDAAGRSADSLMAGDAMVRAGKIHMARGEFEEARQLFEHLLFAVKAVEPKVKATYHLAHCLEQLGESEKAKLRFDEVLKRYPVSPYATRIVEKTQDSGTNIVSTAEGPASI